MSHTPVGNSTPPSRRASLPLPTKVRPTETSYRAKVSLLQSVESPDVSVNAPRIDKIAEFPLASSDEAIFAVPRRSSTSAKCSSSSPPGAVCSITKDKCTVQVVDKAMAAPTSMSDAYPEASGQAYGSECSEHVTADISSRSSAESQQRRFDTSSYQQRAEALEGLLEFSARLLQQQRFEELGVLLKPFGPEKVSPRETAIWLTKSFKETVV